MHVTRKVFDKLMDAAIAALPRKYARWLEEVPVIVEDRPLGSDVCGTVPSESSDEDPLGLYHGAAQVEEEHIGELPPQIVIYRIPLMEACNSREELAEEIRKTLLHELGHHAGLDEEDLDEHGLGPMEEEDDVDWDVDER
jgi:predicted Zn-dependent protease with MMP-like domain